jgi:NodT family efflux transporter outer membrane factor (OMF) lipoprotein
MRTRTRGALAILSLGVLLAATGCAPYKSRMADVSMEVPEAYSEDVAGEALSELDRWWERFGDERLNALMEEAFAENLDLAQAYERMKQARAVARITGSARSPQLDAAGAGGRGRQPGAFGSVTEDTYRLSAAARYEVDLWRKLEMRTAADTLSALATGEDLKALSISISARLADLYYLAAEQRAQIELTDRTIAAFEDSLERVERRYRAGLVSALDVYQARQNLASARAQRPIFEANLFITMNAVYALLGRFPEEKAVRMAAELPAAPAFPSGIPSELLTRRPDIKAALLRLEADDQRVGAAVADRFPSFNLVGEYGGASTELQDVLDSPNIVWNLLLQIAQPVLDGGRRTAEVERSEAVFRESLARYRQTVIFAFTEVEDSITAGRASEQRLLMLEERVAASEGESRLSLDRYLQGLSDYLPVLTAQRRLFESESALLTEKRQLLSDRIELARALGGGWTEEVIEKRLVADRVGKEDKE